MYLLVPIQLPQLNRCQKIHFVLAEWPWDHQYQGSCSQEHDGYLSSSFQDDVQLKRL